MNKSNGVIMKRDFFLSEVGATSIDFAVLTAAIIGLAVAVFTPIQNGASALAFNISVSLDEVITTDSEYFGEWVEWWKDDWGTVDDYDEVAEYLESLTYDQIADYLSDNEATNEQNAQNIEASYEFLAENPNPTEGEAQDFITDTYSTDPDDEYYDDWVIDMIYYVDSNGEKDNEIYTGADAVNERIDYYEMQMAQYDMYQQELESRQQ